MDRGNECRDDSYGFWTAVEVPSSLLRRLEQALLPELACLAALDLAAGGLRDGAGADQNDLLHGELVVVGDRLADASHDLVAIDLVTLRALHLLHDHQLLAAVL